MAFIYIYNPQKNGQTLSKSQEEILGAIENLPFPFGGISKLKDLRDIIHLEVCVSEGIDWKKPVDPIQPAIGEPWDFDEL